MSKRFKVLSLVLSVIMIVSCFTSLNTVFAVQEESNGFIYLKAGEEAILIGVDDTVLGDVVIPDTLGGCKVTMIDATKGVYAFKNKSGITSVTMPNTVTFISQNAFKNCSIESIKFSEGLLRIDDAAFSACKNLRTVELPAALESLGKYAFQNCSALESVTITSTKLTNIGNETFNGCENLESISIPDSINYIGHAAFNNTKFYRTESNWVDGVLALNGHIIEARNNISGRYEIPEGTKSITGSAFINCKKLTEIVIHTDLKRIGEQAFMNCDNLKHVLFYGTVDQRRTIKVEKNNMSLNDATWHYGYDPDVVEYYPGDINADGSVNNKDLTRLFQYLSDWDVEAEATVVDVNGDGIVNNKDLTRLFQYLSDWDVKIFSVSTNFNYSDDNTGPVISF